MNIIILSHVRILSEDDITEPVEESESNSSHIQVEQGLNLITIM